MSSNQDILNAVRGVIEAEDRAAIKRAKIGIAIRAGLTLFILVYMTWISTSITKLDATELTRLAATSVQDKLPMWRSELHDYAVGMAPGATDQVRDLFVGLPVMAREYLEAELLTQTDHLITQFENEVDLAIAMVIEDQIELVQTEFPDAAQDGSVLHRAGAGRLGASAFAGAGDRNRGSVGIESGARRSRVSA